MRDGAHLVFVTHSIPLSMNEGSGPDGGAYVAQHRSVATEVVERVRQETGRRHAHELVYCSRSGGPHPLARARHQRPPRAAQRPGRQRGRDGAVGFVSDHMEVIYDLDTEAVATAEKLELPARARGHAGRGPAVRGRVRDLLLERARSSAAVTRSGPPSGHRAAVGPLPGGLLPNPRGPRPALCGSEA